MKLFLTSAGFENPKVGKKFLGVVGKPAHEIKIIFIQTATTTEGGKYYVSKCEEE